MMPKAEVHVLNVLNVLNMCVRGGGVALGFVSVDWLTKPIALVVWLFSSIFDHFWLPKWGAMMEVMQALLQGVHLAEIGSGDPRSNFSMI